MTRFLLTGGTSCIAAHVLDLLLARGHSVVATVASQQRAQSIQSAHPNVPKDKLDFAIVENVAGSSAFHEAVISEPPFEAVIHTASPHHVRHTAGEERNRALIGSTGILEAIKRNSPTVKRVVITSRYYSEDDWNPVIEAKPFQRPMIDYPASKMTKNTFAERDAWDFVEKEQPNFTLTSCISPVEFGPMKHLDSLDQISSSNHRVRRLITGASKGRCSPTKVPFFVDVRDVALSHVLAAEKKEAAGKRFFIVADKFCNKQIVEIIREKFPQLSDRLPTGTALEPGGFPARIPDFDNRRSVEVLGMTYRSVVESTVDTVKSLQALGPLRFTVDGRPSKFLSSRRLKR